MDLWELDKELSIIYQVDKFEDYCFNGIQVEGKKEIKKVLLSVTLSIDLIKLAIKDNFDAIIVHHGIFGKNHFSLRGYLKERIRLLINNDISLFGIHLPMDANPNIGHNATISKLLELENLEEFNYGFIGTNIKSLNLLEINRILEQYIISNTGFNVDEIKFKIIDYCDGEPAKIAIISGESYKYFEEAVKNKIDLFICGTMAEHIPYIVRENKKSLIAMGHYYSEIPGIIELAKFIKDKYNLHVETWFDKNDL